MLKDEFNEMSFMVAAPGGLGDEYFLWMKMKIIMSNPVPNVTAIAGSQTTIFEMSTEAKSLQTIINYYNTEVEEIFIFSL